MSCFNNTIVLNLIGVAILTTTSHSAMAKPPLSEKSEVLRQASNYAQAIACSTTFSEDSEVKTDINDVYLIESTTDYDGGEEFGTNYIVEWGGDNGCAGGSGTYMGFITSFSRFSPTRPFIVQEESITDNMELDGYSLNPRFIEDVNYNNGVLNIVSSDYSDDNTDGGNNFPRYKYRYTVVHDDYVWKLVSRKLIADNKNN